MKRRVFLGWQRVTFKQLKAGLAGLVILFPLVCTTAHAATVVLDAVKTGLYGSHGEWNSPDYTTGITFSYGAETRGMVAFDVSVLPPGDITSATLSLRNPYTVNDLGGPLELRLYDLPGLYWSNYNGGDLSFINQSNFLFINDGGAPRWGTAFVEPTVLPGTTVSFTLPDTALLALRNAADANDDFFGFGFRVIKADAEEPKPLQYVFGGTAASVPGDVTLRVDMVPVPLPATGWLFLSAGLALIRRVGRHHCVAK